MKWIREHKLITALIAVFGVLIGIICYSYVNEGTILPAKILNSGISAVSRPVSSAAGSAADNVRGIFSYRDILAENEALKEENAELSKRVVQLTLTESEYAELKELSAVLNYQAVAEANGIVTADVVSVDGSKWFNLFTISAGTESGISKNDVVVNGNGLVGRIMDTGNGWSKVAAVIDESSSVSFELMRDTSLMGIVSGDGTGALSGYMFDENSSVIEGDVAVTSKLGMYPEGIEIGTVTSVKYNEDKQLRMVTVEPSADFSKLKKVTVII